MTDPRLWLKAKLFEPEEEANCLASGEGRIGVAVSIMTNEVRSRNCDRSSPLAQNICIAIFDRSIVWKIVSTKIHYF